MEPIAAEPVAAVSPPVLLDEARKALKKALKAKKRDLYGLELLQPDKRVLLVAGKKACHAARKLFGEQFACLTWEGSMTGIDWTPLYGRSIDLWPHASDAGNLAMAQIAEILVKRLVDDTELRILMQDGQPAGWDLAQAEADGWDTNRAIEHVKREKESHIRVFTRQFSQELQRGRPHDGTAPIEAEPLDGTSAEGRSAAVWHQKLGLLCNNAGALPTEHNVLTVLARHPEFAGKFWLDDFSHKLMFGTELFSRDIHAVQILIYLQQHLAWAKLPLIAIERAVVLAGNANVRHPVRDWLKSLVWDRTERLGTFMADAFGARQNEYSAAVGRCWLVSMVARVMQPGCQADCLVVLEGGQGIRKSTALRELGGEWFVESHADPIHDRKEFLQGLQGRWLIEIPEMHTIAGRNSIEKIKGTISNRVDSFRVPYGHAIQDFPRQCIFSGSTNAEQWNPDSTGGRRFWPITCGDIDVEYIRAERQQLFAEAMARYGNGEQWWDVPEEAAKEEQEQRRESDPWEDIIATYIGRKSQVTIQDILETLLQIKPGEWHQSYQNRVARCLKALHWFRFRAYVNDARQWTYRPSPAIAKAVAQKQLDDTF